MEERRRTVQGGGGPVREGKWVAQAEHSRSVHRHTDGSDDSRARTALNCDVGEKLQEPFVSVAMLAGFVAPPSVWHKRGPKATHVCNHTRL